MENSLQRNGKKRVLTYISTNDIRMWNLTWNADKKSTKMIKQRKEAETCIDKKDKTTQEYKPECTGERRKIKRYRQRSKQCRQNRTFQNNERNFYQQLGGDDTKTYQQPDARET